MSIKREPTLKQVFNSWLKYRQKETETFKAKRVVQDLAFKITNDATELFEHQGEIYRLTIYKNSCMNTYKVEVIEKADEFVNKK